MTAMPRQIRKCAAIMLMAGSAIAGVAPLAAPAAAQTVFGTVARTDPPRVQFSGAERGQPILAGTTAQVSGSGFQPGQKVQLLYGANPLPGGALTAGSDGRISGSIAVPANAVAGIHPIVVVADAPYGAIVADLKVSPTIPLFGQDGYSLTEAQVARGIYQSAYSPRSNALFVTSAVGRPPVAQSELVKLDPETLKVLARVTPARAPARREGADGGVFAVYGVGVDDSKGTVWATNTRQDTVSVYRQNDLGLVKQFAPGTVPHSRDVVVDSAAGKAYVSAMTHPDVYVFDTATLAQPGKISIQTGRRGETFSAASLSLDTKAHRLYVVSQSTNEVAVIDTSAGKVEKVLPVPGARGAIGISHDPASGRLYVASQGSDNLVVLDGKDGRVIADTPVGAGALNVVFDPSGNRAYISNRGAGTIAVTDADGKLIASLGPAPLANHVSLGKPGTIYAVDKSAAARGAENDTVLKIHRR